MQTEAERVMPPDFDEFSKETNVQAKWISRMFIAALSFAFGGWVLHTAGDVNGGFVDLFLPLAYFLPEETAHNLVIGLASKNLLPGDYDKDDPVMVQNVAGLRFYNPVGLAAGFDKHCEGPLSFMKMGFGSVEIGSVTPEPQGGNPKPRIFRLKEDRGVINRCGFNSEGADVVERRLEKVVERKPSHPLTKHGVLGVNLGKNKEQTDAAADLTRGVRQLGRFADYLVINVSSPNTPGLRALQARESLISLVSAVQEEIEKLPKRETTGGVGEADFPPHPPLFVKIAPDLSGEELKDVVEVAVERGIAGLIVSNTTIRRPDSLVSPRKTETGGLSGAPLKDLSTRCVADVYRLSGGKLKIIAVGGIFSGDDALEKIEAGASLVQVYTGLIYVGPAVARRIKTRLSWLLYLKEYRSLEEAVGAAHRENKREKAERVKARKKPAFGVA